MKRRILLVILPVLACSALLPRAQAVTPARDCPPYELVNFTTAEGCDALSALTTGAGNTALGFQSLFSNSTFNFNTSVGAGALSLNNADSNTAVGAAALLLNTTGTQNTAVGTDTLVFNDSGEANTATGYFALLNNTTGGSNTASGSEALTANTTGNNNTAIGNQALQSSQTTSDNVIVGRMAGSEITTADNNIIIGHHSGVHSVFGQESNRSYIDNISGAPVSADTAVAVFVDADGRLGTVLVPTPPPATVTPTPIVTVTPTPIVTVTPTPIVTVTPTPIVTVTPTPIVTVTPTPTVTITPTPTATPTPTPISCSWSAGPDLPFAGTRFGGAFFPANGKFYAMGGRDVNNVEFIHPFEYDPVSNSWTTKAASYPDNFVSNIECAVANDSGTDYIYCVGGSSFATQTTIGRVFRYDPIADSITTVVNINWPPGDMNVLPGGISVFNNKIYILGGFNVNTSVTNEIWEFTPNPAGWVQKSAVLPVPRAYVPTTTIGNFIYTGGGADWDGTTLQDTTDSFKYDPVVDSISIIASIPRATSNTRALNFCNQMYVMGGAFNLISNEVDIYDPVSDTWSIGTPFVTARRNFATDTDGTNNIWLAGGYDAGLTIIASTEIFSCPVNPCMSRSFTPTAPRKTKASVEGRDPGGFSPKGVRPQAIPDAARKAMLNLKVQNLQAMIPEQQQQIETLTAQVKEQVTQIQKLNAQLETSKPEAKVVGKSLQTTKKTKEN
jgi:hypothetical protein